MSASTPIAGCLAAALCWMVAGPSARAAQGVVHPDHRIALVTLPTESPLISIRVMFSAGSIHDPVGKEGLSALTALMLGASGTAKRSYRELTEAFDPTAAGIGVESGRRLRFLPPKSIARRSASLPSSSRRRWSSPGSARTTSPATVISCSPT